MARSFGKVVGIAARVKKGQIIMEVDCDKQHIDFAKDALRRAKNKFPVSCKTIVVEQ